MDPNNHAYPPGYPPINEQYFKFLQDTFRQEAEEVNRHHSIEREALAKQFEETHSREIALANEVELLRKQLANTKVKTSQQRPKVLATTSPTMSSTTATILTSGSPLPSTPPRAQATTRSKSIAVPPAASRSFRKLPTPRKSAAQVHRLLQSEVPKDAHTFKQALQLHVRILWGLIEANAVPPTPQANHITIFNAHFSDTATKVDLQQASDGDMSLISPSLVQISFTISPTTRKRIGRDIKNVEESILYVTQYFISKFGLTRWCPDLNQSPYSIYNSACRLIALETFKQAMIAHAYDHLQPSRKFIKDTTLTIKLYDHFVHHHIVKAASEANPQYQACVRLAQSRREFIIRNGYSERYLDLIDAKATSDDEADPNGLHEKKRPVYYIKERPERSRAVTHFFRILDAKREEVLKYDPTKCAVHEHIRRLPSQPQETAFPALPIGIPIDYYDPTFFNHLPPELQKKITTPTIALLPEIDNTFGSSADEYLDKDTFTAKFGKDVLACYNLDDLVTIKDDDWIDDSEDDMETDGD